MTPTTPAFVERLLWANDLALAQRTPPHETDHAAVIAVAALDNRMLTTPTAALVGTLLNSVAELPVVLVDADGVTQPLRGPVGAGRGGDIVGLAQQPAEHLNRAEIERYVDRAGSVPLLSCWLDGPGTIGPELLDAAVHRAQHRWPTVVINLPYTCPNETIAAGTSLAGHVLLVTDRHHESHDWLYQPGHHLTGLAREGRVTVVTVGGEPYTPLPDTVSLPAADRETTARNRVEVPADPESLAMYHRLLSRIYPLKRARE